MSDAPRIAVIVPTYRQGAFAAEAISSALTQDAAPPFVVVAVNDGCPQPETQAVLDGLTLRHPGRVFALHQPNRGLSGARNAGVAFARQRWPGLEAVFFLDSDNLLDPHALGLMAQLLETEPEADWFYPKFDMFGLPLAQHTGGPFSVARLAEGNYCEAGSLVRCRVFEAGVRFDETMRHGYEDWEFWLQACAAGFRGHPIYEAFFRYRKRPGSMLAGAHQSDAVLRNVVKSRHRWLYDKDKVLRHALAEGPLINVIGPGGTAFRMRDVGCLEVAEPADLIEELYAFAADGPRRRTAPYWLLSGVDGLELLRDTCLAPGFLCHMINGLETAPATTATFTGNSANTLSIRLTQPGWHNREPVWDQTTNRVEGRDYRVAWFLNQIAPAQMLVLSTSHLSGVVTKQGQEAKLDHLLRDLRPQDVTVSRPDGAASGAVTEGLIQLLAAVEAAPFAGCDPAALSGWRTPPEMLGPHDLGLILRRNLAGNAPYLAVQRDRPQIGFVAAHLQFGGIEKCMIAMATALRSLDVDAHLFVYGDQDCAATPWLREAFASVHIVRHAALRSWNGPAYLGTKLADRPSDELMAAIVGPLCGMDAVVNSGCSVLNHGLDQLRRRGIRTLTWEHLLETETYGRSYGTPYLALAYEASYDRVLTCSYRLADWLRAEGVAAEKLVTLPNGPGFVCDADRLAAGRADRQARDTAAPLRVGFLGRMDRQKGLDRFLDIATRCRDANMAFQITGRPVVADRDVPDIPDWIAQYPAAYDRPELEAAYDRIDVLLMPSRNEGLPLTILEAQRAGVVPICTDVGAVSEAIDHGTSGFVVDETEAVPAMEHLLRHLEQDRARLKRMARKAPPDQDIWAQNAQRLMDAIGSIKAR
ncbi:glycosyltransferase [Halovulum sp. GXIMD14793]